MKKLLSILLAAVMVLSLASCGGGAASGNAPAGSGSGAAEPTGDTVKVGVLLPLSGATSYYGNVQLQGIQLCADYVNANGGIKSMNGAKIELDVQDSASDPETGVSAFEKLVDDGCVAVVGPYQSTVAASTAPLAIQYGVPYIIVNATGETFMNVENKYVYRTNTGSTDGDVFVTQIVNYLNKVRPDDPLDSVAVVYDEGDWGTSAVASWQANADEYNYKITVAEPVSESTTDMSTVVNKIKTNNCDIVILAAFSGATNMLVQAMSDYECTAKIIGLGGGVGETKFIENCGASAENVMYTSPWLPMYGGASDEAEQWRATYQKNYGDDMMMEACWGFLGMGTITNAIETAGTDDRDAVADALHDINLDKDNYALMFSGYDGVHFCTEGATSPAYEGTRYNQNDALGSNDGMILTQVQNGAWTIVYPTEYNNGQDNINY